MFEYSKSDRMTVLNGYFQSTIPLKLRLFPRKQKKKYIVLKVILEVLDDTLIYTEKELNEILKQIYPDFVTIRRGLVDYHLMSRETDGSKYWINKKD